MELILAAVDAPLADAWDRFCGELPFVRVHRGSIFDVTCDAVVSPANSFGFMDGGIDALYLRRFGRGLQHTLRERIVARHHGELLVGAAEIVPTGDPHVPFMIAAPTMRVPMALRDSVNPYLAARAALLAVLHATLDDGRVARDVIHRVAFPGLGTGVGAIGPATCAHQLRAAIDAVLGGVVELPATWAEASERHQLLYTSRVRGLQRE